MSSLLIVDAGDGFTFTLAETGEVFKLPRYEVYEVNEGYLSECIEKSHDLEDLKKTYKIDKVVKIQDIYAEVFRK